MEKTTLARRTRFASVIAGFAVAAGLVFGGPFIHPPAQDTLTASGPVSDKARCFLSVVESGNAGNAESIADCTGSLKPLKPAFDRRETFDWV
ncbi:hypothetical protein [Streptomyces sp. NBC_00091]|uniref:hypothetical protein n=1 Tax=Streptomyces sp. NBC_00091 TaxID=2975648 RepID=UPI0022500AF9|nr:hypothetical protein [Streptomyces sp. NBC_00091]MCX5376692.1 hypothetical protein [Streptomyces sp. NBC_00091]